MEFKNPPASGSGRGGPAKWLNEAAALRERPGEWALVMQGVSRVRATDVKKGKIAAFPAGQFQATSRAADNGKCDIYIRYIGGEQ